MGFDFTLQFVGQNSHQSLGGEPVFGSLLVITLGHIFKQIVTGQIDVMNDLAEVLFEISIGQTNQIVQSILGNITLPLEFTLTLIADSSQGSISIHPGYKSILQFEALSGGGNFSAGQAEGLFVFVSDTILGNLALITEICSEADQIEVLLDVIHDFGLEESLCGIVHDLVAQLRFGNVFTQLLDAGTLGCRSIFVDDFVAFTFGGISFGESSNEFPDNFEFTTEECVLVLLKFIFVHAEEFKVDSGNGFDETFERCGELELPEEAGRNASGGGTGETNLAIDNDWAVDVGSNEGTAKSIEVGLKRGSGIADWDAIVGKAGEFCLKTLNNVVKGDHLLDFKFAFFLCDIDNLNFATAGCCPLCEFSCKFDLFGLDASTCDIAEFSIFANFVGWPGANWASVNVNDGFLPHVEPNNGSILGPFVSASLINGGFETILSGLSTAENLVSGDPAEVGHSVQFVGQLLDLLEMIQHGRSL